MPSVYCNTCSKISPFKGIIKNAVCPCGSKDLKAVAGKWTDENDGGWNYYDRHGDFVKFVKVDVPRNTDERPWHEILQLPTIDPKENERIAKQLNLDL